MGEAHRQWEGVQVLRGIACCGSTVCNDWGSLVSTH